MATTSKLPRATALVVMASEVTLEAVAVLPCTRVIVM
jgi:hypothetical protein